MLNGLLFRPLPVKDADRLVRLSTKLADYPYFLEVGYPNYRDIRDANETFEDIIAWAPGMPGISTPSFAIKGTGVIATSNYFEFLGMQPEHTLIATVGISKLVGAMLVEISPTDPLTYAVVAAFLIAVAFLSCYIPANRAAGLDPIQALRQE